MEEAETVPHVEFEVDRFPQLNDQFLDMWAGLLDHAVNFTLTTNIRGGECALIFHIHQNHCFST